MIFYGGIAQLGEHLLCKQEVIGSIPFASIGRKGQVCTLKTEYLNSKKKPRIIEINENIAKRPREFERTNLQGQVKKGAR